MAAPVSTINLDTAKRVDITCRKGDTFTISLTFTDENGDDMPVDTHFFKMAVKETDTSVDDVISFDEFSYEIDPGNVVTVTAQYDVMETKESGVYVYDLQSKDGLVVKTWIYGIFKINEDISQV
jgi:hypothetical protein